MAGNQDLKKELTQLLKLAAGRDAAETLYSITEQLKQWENGQADSLTVLNSIRKLASRDLMSIKNRDPAVPAAAAVGSGLLKKADFSDDAWNAVEVLVTLAGI